MLAFARDMESGFNLLLGHESRELSKKFSVMSQSRNKIEQACYRLQVRGSEFPDAAGRLLENLGDEGAEVGGDS